MLSTFTKQNAASHLPASSALGDRGASWLKGKLRRSALLLTLRREAVIGSLSKSDMTSLQPHRVVWRNDSGDYVLSVTEHGVLSAHREGRTWIRPSFKNNFRMSLHALHFPLTTTHLKVLSGGHPLRFTFDVVLVEVPLSKMLKRMNIKKGTLNIPTITGREKDINDCLVTYLYY